MMNEDVRTPLLLFLSLNVVLFIAQISINGFCPDCNIKYFDFEGSGMSQYNTGTDGNYTLAEFTASDLPQSITTVSDTGNIFTDIWATTKNWLIENVPGVRYLVGMVNGIPNFIKSLGIPPAIAFALGYLWQAMTIFLIVMWLKG